MSSNSSPLKPCISGNCGHTTLSLEPSPHAAEIGFRRLTEQQRVTVSLLSKSKTKAPTKRHNRDPVEIESHASLASLHKSFPAPLVLPQDDLALDKNYPSQSLRSWLPLKDRNEVTRDQNVIYVAAPPEIASDVDYINTWRHPQDPGLGGVSHETETTLPIPNVQDVVEYLAAFYHGLPVRLLSTPKLQFAAWDNPNSKSTNVKSSSTKPRFISLNTSTESVRIRTRASKDRVFLRQLSLDDLLDVAISILPKDAYALLLLVQQDLYEDADDIFVCGRAYGGSRVAVVSTARYHPSLDHRHEVDRQHSWPASHCHSYMQKLFDTTLQQAEPPRKKAKSNDSQPLKTGLVDQSTRTPLHAAVSAHKAFKISEISSSLELLSGLWLGRVCRTASHELGHCFGIDHCVYYACSMQGSASLAEDSRQPPYLCPIDLAKMLKATGTDAEQRYLAILNFCHRHKDAQIFVAFAAWIHARLSEINVIAR